MFRRRMAHHTGRFPQLPHQGCVTASSGRRQRSPASEAASEQSLTVGGENSRAKEQNVRGHSSADRITSGECVGASASSLRRLIQSFIEAGEPRLIRSCPPRHISE